MNKRDELKAYINIFEPNIIAITEVKPKNARYTISDCELAIEGYDMFHNLNDQGRGIMLYIKVEMKPSACELIDVPFSENLLIECNHTNNNSLLIGLVYRSPNSTLENNDMLNEWIKSVQDLRYSHILIMGDMNYPQIDWNLESCRASPEHSASKFLAATKDCYLIQHQKTPTRYKPGQTANTLDLVFTNREDMINEISVEGGLGKSDHSCLLINFNYASGKVEKSIHRNFKKTDSEILKQELVNIEWADELDLKNTEESWTFIKDKINHAIEKSTPLSKTTGRRGKEFMTPETLSIVREKHQLYRRWKQTGQDEDYVKYAKVNNKSGKACKKARCQYEKKIAETSKENQKPFWNYTKSKTKSRIGIADLKKEDGSKTSTDKEKAQLLNQFFKSVFTEEDDGALPNFDDYDCDSFLETFDISEERVKKLLKELKIGKAPGPDGIPPSILVQAADILSKPLTLLFRKSLAEATVPTEWKIAYVSPIFKKGSRTSVNNYRPVSLTSIVCKTMEKLIRENMMTHLVSNNIISRHQHGFVPGRSCVTQILEALDVWTNILDEGGGVDVIYMDFQKAFDSVPHRRLLLKMKATGIHSNVLGWVQSFLSDRKQKVVINGTFSDEANVTSGIPQGSVLGPLLFVLYINDLPNGLRSTAKLFADDTKLFNRSDTTNGPIDLQRDLDELQDWSARWLLKFHPQKCCVVRIGNGPENDYFMQEKRENEDIQPIKLNVSSAEKDLGIVIDSKLTFKNHVLQSCAKANKILGIIRRSFDHLTNKMFVQLYKSLVRPHLEYGHCAWDPNLKYLCQDIENVQRRATKLLGNLKNKPYSERLRILKLPTMEHRRLRGDIIETFKYLNNFYDVEKPKFNKPLTSNLRGHPLKLAHNRSRLEIRRHFFANRIVETWNNLPESVVTAPSVDALKRRLDKHWEDLPSLYQPTCFSDLPN